VASSFLLCGASARADVGVSLGPRGGVQLSGKTDAYLGADVRLKFALSPLVLNPAFDYYFDEQRRLYQIAVNALYSLPISAAIRPYAGLGMGLTFFKYDEAGRMPGVMGSPTMTASGYDAEGSRVGLNLIVGVSFPTRWLTPFVHSMVSYGKIDLVTVGGDVLFDLVGGP
jgi:opacity protein-like surface antigen